MVLSAPDGGGALNSCRHTNGIPFERTRLDQMAVPSRTVLEQPSYYGKDAARAHRNFGARMRLDVTVNTRSTSRRILL
jgi:hypothetical protein